MKELLRQLEKYTKTKFVEVRNDGVYFISNGKQIPEEHLIVRRKPRTEGFYRVSSYVCGGEEHGCAIGKPAQKCINNKIVNKRCGKYALEEIGSQLLNIEDITQIVKFFGGKIK